MGISRTGVIAGLLAGVLAGDVAGVVHVSGEQREAAAAARKAADAAWVTEVRALAEDLLQARAPISDAGNLFQGGELADAVRYDVYVRGAAAADLAGVRDRLDAVRPPDPRAQTHRELQSALAVMHEAALGLADENDEVIGDELISFDDAAADWDRVVTAEVADDLPTATTIGSSGPLTRAGQLFRWSSACAKATEDGDAALPEESEQDPERIAESLAGTATVLDRLLTELLAVVPAEADAPDVQRDLQPALSGMREAVPTFQKLGEAVRALDSAAAEEALVMLDRLDPLFESASRFFEAHGSTVCSGFFDAGVLLGDTPPPADDLATT